MNSVQYDSQLCATIPISDYHAVTKAFNAVCQDNYEKFITGESNQVEQPTLPVAPVNINDYNAFDKVTLRRERLRKLAKEIASSF